MAEGAYEPFPPVEAWAAVSFDPALYQEHAALLDNARTAGTEEARERAVRTAIRYAGTDTGAIEGLYTTDRGFTRTVAIEAAAWEAAAEERGPNAAAIIKDQIAAYEWVLDLVTQKVPVTEHVVRELHAMLCRSQDTYVVHTDMGRQERPLPKGEYKTLPNNPTSLATGGVHYYAPPGDVQPEMHRLVSSMESVEYAALHPVVQAAYVHYALAAIHPFSDGNGRTARALASVPLYRDRSIPLMILAEDRDEYLDALGEADGGNLGAFVSFVAERVVDTLQLAALTLRAGRGADIARSVEALRRATAATGGLSNAELDAMAHRLLYAFVAELATRIGEADLPPGVSLASEDLVHFNEPYGHYRPVAAVPLGVVLVGQAAPAPTQARVAVQVLVAAAPHRPPLALEVEGERVTFSLRELEPRVRAVARLKMTELADMVIARVLAALAEQAR